MALKADLGTGPLTASVCGKTGSSDARLVGEGQGLGAALEPEEHHPGDTLWSSRPWLLPPLPFLAAFGGHVTTNPSFEGCTQPIYPTLQEIRTNSTQLWPSCQQSSMD